MIDLTYLTDQEQGMIMSVLKRDTNLKNTEEQRIKQLRKTEKDRSRLKYLTGDWFYDTKYKRHRDRINGTDILRASMGLRKPVTISEISQRFENPSCVNMERKDVFVPPELSGLIEEPSTQSQNERRTLSPSPPNKVDEWQFPEGQQEKQRPQIKPRQNPFNSVRSQRDTDSLKNGVKTDRAPTEESLAAESSSPHNAILNPDNTESQCTAKPVPKKRLLLYTRKELLQDASRISPGVKQIVTPAPRSISKKNGSNHKSVNSLRLHIPTNTDDSSYDQSSATISPISLEMPFSPPLSLCSVQSSSEWVDKRQVHFSSIVQPIESEREVRGVQDEDWSPLADGEKEQDRSGYINNDYHELNVEPQSTQVSNLHTTAAVTGKAIQFQTHKVTEEEGHFKVLDLFGRGFRDGMLTKLEKSPVQREKNQEEPKDEGTSDAKSEDLAPPVEQPKTKTSPKPCKGFFAFFSRAETKYMSLEVLVSDEEVASQSKKETPCIFRPEADDGGSQDESKKTNLLHLTSNTEDENKTGSPVRECGSHENDLNALDSSIRLSEPKPSNPFPNPVDVESGEVSALSNECSTPSVLESNTISKDPVSKKQADMIKIDANLVKQKDNTPGNELQDKALAESLSRDMSDLNKEIATFKMSFSQQENKVSINELKSFWKKEKSGLRVTVGSPTNIHNIKDSSGELSQCSSPELSKSQPDIRSDNPDLMSSLDRMSLKNKKMDKNEESPCRVPEQDHQDIRGRVPYTTQNTFKPQSVSDKHLKQNHSSLIRNVPADGQNNNQPSTDIYQSKDQDQTRTTSPLRQFKVPPRDFYPNKESRKNGSPLRTFLIDINPADRSPGTTKAREGQTKKDIPLNSVQFIENSGQTNCLDGNPMSPPQDSSNLLIVPLVSVPFHSTAACSQVSALEQPCMSLEHGKTLEEDIHIQPIMPKERKLSSDARLARSFIPLSLQYYLGLPEQTVSDERKRLEVQAGEASKQMNRGEVSSESSPSLSYPDSEEITFDSSGSSTPEDWSFSCTSSACNSEEHSPVRAALERANARPISVSKSLENLLSTPSLSAETPDTKPSSSDDEQMKMMSTSVPAFIHQEMDYSNSDCASVSSFYSDRLAACNASSTFSICSEVASLSSVTGSVISIYSSEFGNVEVKGTVQFAIQYLQKLGEFHIFVVQCKNLAVADPRKNRSDPYVKCYLLPDKARYGKRKTCVRKKTLDPTYNEVLRFKIPMKTLKTQKLNLSVWHNDTFGHNSFLGEVEIDLAEWDLNKTQMNECLLKGRVQVPPSPKPARSEEIKAEMRVALRFLQQTSHTDKNEVNGEVQIWVKECKNLPMSQGVSVDPFVKCAVLPDSSHKNCQKTRVLKRAFNPEFDHTMVYDCFSPEDLNEVCVELTVWDHDRLHNHLIGGIRLGPGTGKSYGADVDWMDSNTAETALWKKLMQSQNEWVEGVLPLRMLLMAI